MHAPEVACIAKGKAHKQYEFGIKVSLTATQRGHSVVGTEVYIAGQKRGITRALRRALKRLNAIEPIIGHTKHDGLMGRNYLKGTAGDAMNAILAAAGHNLRIILRKLRLCWLCCCCAIQRQLSMDTPTAAAAWST